MKIGKDRFLELQFIRGREFHFLTSFSARKPECVGHKGWIQVGNKSLYFGLRPQQNYSLALEHWDLAHIYAIVLLFPFGLFFFFGVCSSLIRVGVGGGKGASKVPSNTIHEGVHWYDVY